MNDQNISMAQAVITCELCQDESVLMHCNSCKIKLCNDCVGKHVTSQLSKQHDVVGFKYRKSDVNLPQCANHLHQKCDIYCKNCDCPICSKCVVTPEHKQHEMIDIMDEYLTKRELISRESGILEKFIIRELDKVESTVGLKMSKLSKDYDNLVDLLSSEFEKKVLELKSNLKEKKAALQSSHERDLKELRSQLESISRKNQEAKQIKNKYKGMLSGMDVATVLSSPFAENQFRDVPALVEICAPKYSPCSDSRLVDSILGELDFSNRSTAVEGYKISTEDHSFTGAKVLLDEPVLLSTFQTDYERVHSIFCVGNNEVWVVGSVYGTVTRFNIRGTKLETVQVIKGYSPNDIHVDKDGNITFCDMGERNVSMWSKGKRETIYAWKKWKPTALCVNKLGHILVCLITQDKLNAKVVRLVKSKPKQKIQFDDQGRELFLKPQTIVENINENICVLNMGAKGLVVLDKFGKFRFSYDGSQANLPYFFRPTSVTSDYLGHLLITDAMNNCVHILDQDGQFLLGCVGRSMLNIAADLSLDENDNLWVGELHTGKIKVIKYLTSRQEVESIPSK